MKIENIGKREFTGVLCTDGKKKTLMSGDVMDVKDDLAKKLLKSYPKEIRDIEGLVKEKSGDLVKKFSFLSKDEQMDFVDSITSKRKFSDQEYSERQNKKEKPDDEKKTKEVDVEKSKGKK